MQRSIRRLFSLAGILAAFVQPTAGSAGVLFARDFSSDALVIEPVESEPIDAGLLGTRGGVVGPTSGGVATECFPLTPVVHETAVSVAPAGSGLSCTRDDECSGAGEYCRFTAGSTAGTCQASGLLSRGDIHYVAGGMLDVDVTLPVCTYVSDVLLNGASIGASGGFEASGAGSFTVVSTVATTAGGQPAVRHKVRIQFSHYGFGDSFSMAVQAQARVGGETAISAPFTVADVDAVNAAMRNSVAETRVRNGFVTSLYEKFGDYEEVWEDGELKAHRPDWSELPAGGGPPTSIGFADASDIRIGSDSVVFSMHFQAPECGETDVNAIGWFDLVPAGDGVDLVWLQGPRVGDDSGVVCNLLATLWELVAGDLFDEAALADEIGQSIEGGFDVDESNHITVCPSCRMIDTPIGDGRIDILSVPPVDRVRVRVSTTRRTDPTADPEAMGLIIPAGTYAPIAVGGTYQSCQTSDGQSPATCAPQFALDMEGLFNWWGNDVPVPSPIEYDAQGHGFVLGGRQHAWGRLDGVLRDVTKLPAASFPVGSLLARRTSTNVLLPTARARVSNGCVMPPVVEAPYRVSFGVNDIAVPATGEPPTSGELELTVLLTDVPSQSKELFGDSSECQAAPITSTLPHGPVFDGDLFVQ
jgi:hypothetical protein